MRKPTTKPVRINNKYRQPMTQVEGRLISLRDMRAKPNVMAGMMKLPKRKRVKRNK